MILSQPFRLPIQEAISLIQYVWESNRSVEILLEVRGVSKSDEDNSIVSYTTTCKVEVTSLGLVLSTGDLMTLDNKGDVWIRDMEGVAPGRLRINGEAVVSIRLRESYFAVGCPVIILPECIIGTVALAGPTKEGKVVINTEYEGRTLQHGYPVHKVVRIPKQIEPDEHSKFLAS